MTESTWEPAASLPLALVDEYEVGIAKEIQDDTLASAGQTLHMLSTASIQPDDEPRHKRPKTDIVSDPSGYN